jgi:ribosomal protein L19
MTVIFADTETLNAREGCAIGVEDKIRVRVLLSEKKRARQKRTAGIVVAPALEELRRPSCVLRRRQQRLL